MRQISDLDWELYLVERAAVAAEWQRLRQAEMLLADVDARLARMRQILNDWSTS
ncbi:hypothetical protein [Sphaerimonospora thailandensis]|uniref:Uncharacterized protein n=1 Tax=Sphaerimonospora thailandensis TaxID=795644 RepID=A0A8J3R6T4_9ACTN|nr:hypothetical protein [Sphaerimonospora thailandensis]GIH69415.1 hypothetical protein Mth01_16680 [Sphaerimonospora thailandensis]